MTFRLLLLSAIGVAMGSCGHPADSGSSSIAQEEEPVVEPKIVTLRGIVVDGYVKDARVCVLLDGDEINCTTTDANGSYAFAPHSFAPDASLDLRATGGVDTATQKPYSGALYERVELDDVEDGATIERNITPLSDLGALLSLSTGLNRSRAQALLAQAYEIAPEQVSADPMRNNALFVANQDIEQSKALLAVMAGKLHEDSLEQTELESIRKDIREALAKSVHEKENVESLDETIRLLEERWQKSVPFWHKFYVNAQRKYIYDSLQNFANNSDLNIQNRVAFQERLVSDVDAALESFQALEGDSFLTPRPIEIDIFAPSQPIEEPTEEPTDANETNVSEPDPGPIFNIAGRMVDGYISAATICVDANADAMCDINEPRTTTQEDGRFSFAAQGLEEKRHYRVIAYGGMDSATQKSFDGEYLGVLSTFSPTATLLLTPINDLVARMFFRSQTLSASTLEFVQGSIAGSLGLQRAELAIDPMSVKRLMLASMRIESVYGVLASVAKSELALFSLSSRQKSLIREAILEEFINSGYLGFSASQVVIRAEVKLGAFFSQARRDFAIAQIRENLSWVGAINAASGIEQNSFERIQRLFDAKLSEALASDSFTEMDLSASILLYSEFSKNGASYDARACLMDSVYIHSHTQKSDAPRYSDASNGIVMGFDTNKSDSPDEFTLFYPSLGEAIKTDVQVRFYNNYYFSYDTAWIPTGKSIYIKTPIGDGLSTCYKIVLDQLYGNNLKLEPVYRYTDAP